MLFDQKYYPNRYLVNEILNFDIRCPGAVNKELESDCGCDEPIDFYRAFRGDLT